MEEQTFNYTDPETGGEKDVQDDLDQSDSQETVLQKLSEITGREFKDEEDFKKHYKELSSFVGKNPKQLEEKAKLYDEQISNSKDKLEGAQTGGASSAEIQSLKNKIEEMELLREYPEASKILNTIRSVASSQQVSLKEAFESDLKDLFQSKLEAERRDEEERNSSVDSKSRISSSKASKLASLAEQVKATDTDEAKEALVREFLTE
jgi:hypothetical protein